MKESIAGLLASFLGAVLLVFIIIFGTLTGALSGWIVGWFFGDTILAFFSYIFGAAHGLSMWQIGASLGFIGGFFRTSVSAS